MASMFEGPYALKVKERTPGKMTRERMKALARRGLHAFKTGGLFLFGGDQRHPQQSQSRE